MKLNIQLFGGRGASSSVGGIGTEAIDHYVSGEGMWINDYLRGNEAYGELSPNEKRYLEELDMATNGSINNDVLYRTVDANSVFNNISEYDYETLKDVLVNNDTQRLNVAKANQILSQAKKEYTEKGFMSTTKSLSIAEENQYFFGSQKPIVMEIHTNKKTKGLDVMKNASKRTREAEKINPQKEVLLARNQSVEIYNIGSKNGNIYVKARLK